MLHFSVVSVALPSLLSFAQASPSVVNLDPNGVINLINAVIGWGQKLGMAIGALALLIAGYQFLMAWGSTRSLQGATESVKFGVIGMVLILACYVVPNLLQAAASAGPASGLGGAGAHEPRGCFLSYPRTAHPPQHQTAAVASGFITAGRHDTGEGCGWQRGCCLGVAVARPTTGTTDGWRGAGRCDHALLQRHAPSWATARSLGVASGRVRHSSAAIRMAVARWWPPLGRCWPYAAS